MLSQIFIELSNTRNPTFITFRSVRWYVHTGQYMSSLILFFPVFIEYLINIFSFSVFILYQYEQKFNPLMHNVPKWSACSKWLGMCGHFLWIAPYKKIKGVWSWFYSSGGSKKLWAWTFIHTSWSLQCVWRSLVFKILGWSYFWSLCLRMFEKDLQLKLPPC